MTKSKKNAAGTKEFSDRLKEINSANDGKDFSRITITQKHDAEDDVNSALSETGHDGMKVHKLTFGSAGKKCLKYEPIVNDGIITDYKCVLWE